MKNLREINRRMFLEYLSASAVTAALIRPGLKAEVPPLAMPEDEPNTHNMLVFGEKKIY